jgi:glyoxylase-like metal-dependent hydrolase (beta-lactamase superfamily II)
MDSFLVVAEAPLESKNGELIIKEAKKIAPHKPIKYFVFGHHHPQYLGGVRPFINNGTTILTHSSNTDYLKQVATFKHTIQPDALQMSNKPLLFEVVDEKRIIKDSNFEMQIIHIGWMSKHTDDYLVYYFPKYKLLFEDDLVWIKKEGGAKPAGERQKGLYDAIKKYGLDVETIIQSWPINYMEVKTEISFKELEESVQLIKKE